MSKAIITFSAGGNEPVEPFLEQIQEDIFAQERQRDDSWVADYVATRLKGRALVWFYTLDEDVQTSWKKLRRALATRFSQDAVIGPSTSSSLAPPPEYSPRDPQDLTLTTPQSEPQSLSPRPESLSARSTISASQPANAAPSRFGYIQVQDCRGYRLGYLGPSKKWYEIKKFATNAMCFEAKNQRASLARRETWTFTVKNPSCAGPKYPLPNGLAIRGPGEARTAAYGWAIIRDPAVASTSLFKARNNCWVIGPDEEVTIIWHYDDGMEMPLIICELRGMLGSNGLTLRSHDRKLKSDEIPLRLFFQPLSDRERRNLVLGWSSSPDAWN